MGTIRNPFQKVKVKAPPKSLFNLSHEVKMSGKMTYLYPILCEEYLPGDNWQVSTEVFMRIAPMIAPIMHRFNVFVHFFDVPYRQVWENWEKFITGDWDGTDTSVVPHADLTEAGKSYFQKGRLSDYFGFAIDQTETYTNTCDVNWLPFRAYVKIFNEYYADPTFQNQLTDYVGDTVSTTERNLNGYIKQRAWEKDYFTSCLPWPQRGSTVSINATATQDTDPLVRQSSDGTVEPNADLGTGADGILENTSLGVDVYIDQLTGITVDVEDLRWGMRLQTWLEKNARAGSRYVEQLLAHWGVKSDDLRHQRPRYLGGGMAPVTISEVLNTSDTASADQGNMSGHGISVGRSNTFRSFFKEHGVIIGILSVMPRTAYQQGIPRQFLRQDKYDFAWPEFAHIGEQEVEDRELYIGSGATDLNPQTTFGYQQRYGEYKYRNDRVAGDFRDSLDHWHLGRIFAAKPSLNSSFITANDDNRFLAVQDSSDYLYFQIYNNVKAIRPLPYYTDPRL